MKNKDTPSKAANEAIKETLSALLDAEAGKNDALELRRLAKSIEQDERVLANYQRYSIVSAVMRDESLGASANFVNKVRASIERDQALPAAHYKTSIGSFKKIAGQFAVAASVAVVAVLAIQKNQWDAAPSVPRVLEASTIKQASVVSQVVTPIVAPIVAQVDQTSEKLGAHNNRLIYPQVVSVSAGDRRTVEPQNFYLPLAQPECLIGAAANESNGMRELHLPDGYVLCHMEESQQRCQALTSTISCRFE